MAQVCDFRIWRREYKISEIGRFTKFSKKENEHKISDLNIIENATIYQKQKENETGIDCGTEKLGMRAKIQTCYYLQKSGVTFYWNIQCKCAKSKE